MPNFSLSSPRFEDYETYQNEYWKTTHRYGSVFGVIALWLSLGLDFYLHHLVVALPLAKLVIVRVVGTVQLLTLLRIAMKRDAGAQRPLVFLNFICSGTVVGFLAGTGDSFARPPSFWAASLCVVFVCGSYPNSLAGSLSLSFATIIPFFAVYFWILQDRFWEMLAPFIFVLTTGPVLTLIGSLSLRRALLREFQTGRRLAVTLQDVGDGVIATGSSGKILLVNRKAHELTGISQAQASGRALDEVFPWLGKYSVGAHEPVELRIPDCPKETWISLTVSPMDGAIFSFQDVTQRKRYELETLRNSRMEALKLVAGGIAHDFNNLLMAVTGNASLLRDESTLSEDVRETIGHIEEASIRASELAGHLLTFSKGGSPVKEVLSLGDIIKTSASFVLSGSKVKLDARIPDDLWPCAVDATQFGRVVQNLTVNAVEAMPNGGTIWIECRNMILEADQGCARAGKHVEVTFRDQGEGIPEDLLGQIFDPYFTTKETGSGLGLAASYSIVEAHGGTLSVNSTVGQGTEFRILLPATDVAPRPRPVEPIKVSSHSGGRVLILEDEAPVARVLSIMLRKLGFECTVTAHGEETVEAYRQGLAQEQRFQFVILDLTVPGGMGGQEAVKRLLELDPQVKAIVSSGYSDGDVLAGYQKFGFQARLAKPYGMDQLSQVIGEFMTEDTGGSV